MEPILMEWEHYARKNQPTGANMNEVELRNHAQGLLEMIVADMMSLPVEPVQRDPTRDRQPGSERDDTVAQTHADCRLASGFSIDVMVSEYGFLRATVLRLFLQENEICNPEEVSDLIHFNEVIDQAVAESVTRHAETVTRHQNLFLGIIGHDLRAPLQFLSFGAQSLKRAQNVDDRLSLLGSHMVNSVLRMKEMLDNLMDFTQTRLGGGLKISLIEADLARISGQVVEEFRSANPDRVIRNDVIGDCTGRWDAGRVGQIYQNLIGNALQHGSLQGEVIISTEGTPADVVFTVHNLGPAIAESDLERFFDLLQQGLAGKPNPNKNMGLGLYVARQIVTAHNGTISVTSSETEGTTFRVWLPKQLSAPATVGRGV